MTDRSRRKFNKVLGGGVALIPLSAVLGSRTASAAAVDPESAQAKALQFVVESAKQDQLCSGCIFYTSVDDANGNCVIFANGEVPARGWCTSFKSGK